MKRVLVCGAGGFIGSHLVRRLRQQGVWVRGVDVKEPEFSQTEADEFIVGDLRSVQTLKEAFSPDLDEVYQLAADMGGAGYIFTGEHDAQVMSNSAHVNLNVAEWCRRFEVPKVFFSSSACVYPEHNQRDNQHPYCEESSAYPANPDSEYGWEKLFSERLYLSYQKNYGIEVRIARFHNIFGEEGTWTGGREKSPAALCRKVAEAAPKGTIEIWGDGQQTRSYLYIEECLTGVQKLMESDFTGPVNIGSEEMVSINTLAKTIMKIAGKDLQFNHVRGPLGVRGRNSDNRLIREKLGWEPSRPLTYGLTHTYHWIERQVQAARREKSQTLTTPSKDASL